MNKLKRNYNQRRKILYKFLVAKSDRLTCFYSGCGGQILHGEPYIGIFWGKKERIGETEIKRRKCLIFHTECYCKWFTENIVNKFLEWKMSMIEPEKRGRPKKYKDGKAVHRLKSLLRYYKLTQQPDKVQELEQELSKLEIRRTDGNS
jgi:hypothetical protein